MQKAQNQHHGKSAAAPRQLWQPVQPPHEFEHESAADVQQWLTLDPRPKSSSARGVAGTAVPIAPESPAPGHAWIMLVYVQCSVVVHPE